METTINFVATTEQFSPLFYDRIIFDSFVLLLLFFFGNRINLLVDVVLMAAKQKQRRHGTQFKHGKHKTR